MTEEDVKACLAYARKTVGSKRPLRGEVVGRPTHEARTAYLAARRRTVHPKLLQLAASSEDAFDAAVSALVMSEHASELVSLTPTVERSAALEGAIWYPGDQRARVDR